MDGRAQTSDKAGHASQREAGRSRDLKDLAATFLWAGAFSKHVHGRFH